MRDARDRYRVAAAIAALALGLSACGAPSDSGAPPSASKTSIETAAPPKSAEPVSELQFTATTLSGGRYDGRKLVGKDTVLWFWAPWCTECRREAPHVAAAQAARADVTFVGVAGLGEVSAMQTFVSDYEVGSFEHLADLDGSLWQRFGVVQQPAYAFVDADGTVDVVRGELGRDGLDKRLDALTNN